MAHLLSCLKHPKNACQLQNCERALTQVHPGQRVNCIPGILSLAQKHRLVATLTSHYGEGAFELIPRSWLLPSRYWQWRLWAEAEVMLLPHLAKFSFLRKATREIVIPGSTSAIPHLFSSHNKQESKTVIPGSGPTTLHPSYCLRQGKLIPGSNHDL